MASPSSSGGLHVENLEHVNLMSLPLEHAGSMTFPNHVAPLPSSNPSSSTKGESASGQLLGVASPRSSPTRRGRTVLSGRLNVQWGVRRRRLANEYGPPVAAPTQLRPSDGLLAPMSMQRAPSFLAPTRTSAFRPFSEPPTKASDTRGGPGSEAGPGLATHAQSQTVPLMQELMSALASAAADPGRAPSDPGRLAGLVEMLRQSAARRTPS